MSWRLISALAFGSLALSAEVWPEALGVAKRLSLETVPAPKPDAELWEELGVELGEAAQYERPDAKFRATAIRLKDPTSAVAFYLTRRPAGAQKSALAELAAETPTGLIVAVGNYVLEFDGWKPEAAWVNEFGGRLPRLDSSSLPPLLDELPADKQVALSDRYILGPATLERFLPMMPPSVAAFHLGAEAYLASYTGAAGDEVLAVFAYPTPNIAKERVEAFRKIPSMLAKRSGPMIALVAGVKDPDAAERLMARVRYEVNLTWSEPRPGQDLKNFGSFIINVFIFIGILLAFATIAGLAFGGFRYWRRLKDPNADREGGMVVLHIAD